MKTRLIVYAATFLSLIMMLSACGSTDDGTSSTDTDSSGSTTTDIFTAPANPLKITLELDAGLASSATISAVNGGTLNATGADGTAYSLVIPPNALAQDTLITMTPVKSITDLSFSGGLGGAVRFEPEGLYFYKEAILSITPVKNIPIENQIMFGFDSNGSDVHLAMPVVSSNAIQIRLEHFSGAGVGNGVSAEKAAIYNRMADSAENRLTSEMADALSRERQRQLLGIDNGEDVTATMTYALSRYENDVLKPRMKAAMSTSGTCADAKRAIQSLLGWERQRQLLGVSDDSVDMSGLMDAAGRKCADEEYKMCEEQHVIVRILPFVLGLERQMQLLGIVSDDAPSNALLQYAWGLVEKCFRFDLKFESAAQFDDGVGSGHQSSVKSTVPIRMTTTDLNFKLKMKDSPLLENTAFNWIPSPECTVTNARGGGQFKDATLSWETIVQNKEFLLKDFKLNYFPGETSESFTEVCEDQSYTSPPTPYWTHLFILTHQDECDSGEGCFVSKNWTIQNAELIGQKEWSKEFTVGGTTAEDIGSMNLYHRPGQ